MKFIIPKRRPRLFVAGSLVRIDNSLSERITHSFPFSSYEGCTRARRVDLRADPARRRAHLRDCQRSVHTWVCDRSCNSSRLASSVLYSKFSSPFRVRSMCSSLESEGSIFDWSRRENAMRALCVSGVRVQRCVGSGYCRLLRTLVPYRLKEGQSPRLNVTTVLKHTVVTPFSGGVTTL